MILFKTERLLIRHAKNTDSQFILSLLNSPAWLKFIGDKKIYSSASALDYITSLKQGYKTNGYGLYILDEIKSRRAIGITGFVKREYLNFPDLGFAIAPGYESKGYSLEAALGVLEYGREILRFKTILAITKEENLKAIKLLQNLGFKPKGFVTSPENKIEYKLFRKTSDLIIKNKIGLPF